MDPVSNAKDNHDDNDEVDDDYDDEREEEDDVVVQEIDVYLTASPLADGASLYIMQYPLRPSWRPYELSERCEEVWVKPKQSQVEVVLSLDVDGQNYDQEVAALRLQKQTLSSSRTPSISNFAVGIRTGNQLHLNPVDAVVQLRPSKACLNIGGDKRKQTAPSQDANTKPSEGKVVPGDSNEKLDDTELWVPLAYHSFESSFTDNYQKKMVSGKNNDTQFAVKQSDYANILCPGTSSNKKGAVGPSRRFLLSMPLEERLKKWLSEGPQVNRFASLLHLAPNDSIEDVLKVLQQYADLVQGLWVSKSCLLYDDRLARARDYILYQFSKSYVIHYDKQRPPPTFSKQILGQLAVQRPALNDWKFKEPTDLAFIKCYPNIVKEQEFSWSGRAEQLMASLCGAGKTKESQVMDALVKSLNPLLLKKTADLGKVDHAPKSGVSKIVSSAETTMLNGFREDLIKSLSEIFHLHGVLSLNAIIKELKGRINASIAEVQSAVSEVAVDIHGVYALKSLRNPTLDPLRKFIIDLFRKKNANVKFKEQDVRSAAKNFLQRNVSDSEFKQVVSELCISKGGGLALKTSDSDQK